ncbi:MAG: PD40 domain-containing protein [Leptolyngbya sp.]|nr:PD40 domain-containing protein [Candidatus Melainabacteria bacterium]
MPRKSAISDMVRTFLFAVSIPLLAACNPEQHLAWSPDGKVLAVIGTDGLRISTNGGTKLSEPIDASAGLLSWFGDSKRLLVVSGTNAQNWSDVQKKIDKSELDKIKTCAKQLKDALEKCDGNFTRCREMLKQTGITADYIPEALHYLRTTDDAVMTKMLGNSWQSLKLAETQVVSLQIGELSKNSLELKEPIFNTSKKLESAKVSPTNEYISVVDTDRNLRIFGVEQREKGWRALSKVVTTLPDWDANTNVLYVVRQKTIPGEPKNEMQELVALKIDYKKEAQIAYEHLANVHNSNQKLRATASGDIYLMASDVGFAALKKSKGYSPVGLYNFNLASAKARKLYSPSTNEGISSFEVSPDGKFIAISSNSGLVKILSSKDGKVRSTVAQQVKGAGVIYAPVWRNNDELCFQHVFPNKNTSRLELYSLETSTTKELSANWPSKAIVGILNETESSSMSLDDMMNELRTGKP